MTDTKKEIAYSIANSMSKVLDQEQLKTLEMATYVALDKYDIQEKSTEVAIYQGDITLELIKRFLISKKLKNLSNRTIKYYNQSLKKIFSEIGKTPIDVEVDDLRMFLLKRQMSGVSDVTVNNEIRVLSSFYGWMAAEEIRPANPMLKIDTLKEKRKQKEAFTEMEIEVMRSSINNKKDKAIFEVLVSTWARVSEIANIKIEEINGDQVIVHGKGNKDRYVFLTPRAQIAIAEYLGERNDTNPYLFPRKANAETSGTKKDWWKDKEWVDADRHADINTIGCFIRNLGRKNKIKAHPHKFRRTGATLALRRGMPLITVSRTLGHESIDTTQIYLDISDNEVKEAHMRYC